MSRFLISFAFSLLVAELSFGECRATVEGRVINERGAPVPHAQVSFQHAMSLPQTGKLLHSYEADNRGSFHIADLDVTEAGTYWVLAKKIKDGYPEMAFAFYVQTVPPLINVKCGTVISGILVKIGPKVAYITHVTVVDNRSGMPIGNATISLHRTSPPIPSRPGVSGSIATSATLTPPYENYPGLAVPSNVDIAYSVSAPGYVSSPEKLLHLPPLKRIELSVQLEPSAAPKAKRPLSQ